MTVRRRLQSNALFMYLWSRRYETSDYSAFALFRVLDGWVARLIGYTDARANYARLQEIPKRLREHADRLAAEADSEEQALSLLWKAAREHDDLGALDASLGEAEARLTEVDLAIEATVAEEQGLLEERARYATGDDENTRAAIDLLTAQLRETELMQLFREARDTLRTDDDRLVGRIVARQEEFRRLETSQNQMRDGLDRRLKRMKAIGSVAAEFRQRHYASPNSAFRDGALIGILLKDYLEGALSRDRLWDEFSRQQRTYRTSGAPVGMSSRRTVAVGGSQRSSGGGRSGGVGRSSGSANRSSGGGFRTGGGF